MGHLEFAFILNLRGLKKRSSIGTQPIGSGGLGGAFCQKLNRVGENDVIRTGSAYRPVIILAFMRRKDWERMDFFGPP